MRHLIIVLLVLLFNTNAHAQAYIEGKFGFSVPSSIATGTDVPGSENFNTFDTRGGIAGGGEVGYSFLSGKGWHPRVGAEILHLAHKVDATQERFGCIAEFKGQCLKEGLITDAAGTLDFSTTHYFVNGYLDYEMKDYPVRYYVGGGIDVGGEGSQITGGTFLRFRETHSMGLNLQMRYVFGDKANSFGVTAGIRYLF